MGISPPPFTVSYFTVLPTLFHHLFSLHFFRRNYKLFSMIPSSLIFEPLSHILQCSLFSNLFFNSILVSSYIFTTPKYYMIYSKQTQGKTVYCNSHIVILLICMHTCIYALHICNIAYIKRPYTSSLLFFSL